MWELTRERDGLLATASCLTIHYDCLLRPRRGTLKRESIRRLEQENHLIFVSIAAYRDLQLAPTVASLLAMADEPSLLRFGICRQHSPNERALPFADDPRFRILDIDHRQSRGACWARAEAMSLYRGEQWFLQVDSHCRFVQGWDTKLIRMVLLAQSGKPVISTYANPFDPADPSGTAAEVLAGDPQQMAFAHFTPEGIPMFRPQAIACPVNRILPLRARFLSGGFLFAPGSFVQDVPYDPQLYFYGEEISMSLRAYTSGYDLFCPTEVLAWHDYVRNDATRHWEDHAPADERPEPIPEPMEAQPVRGSAAWKQLDMESRQRVVSLLIGDDAAADPSLAIGGRFGLGTARTRDDYESYIGIDLKRRKVQDGTRLGLEPPNPAQPPNWAEHLYTWLVRVAFDPARLSPADFSGSGFWLVTLEDEHRREILRRDFSRGETEAYTGSQPEVVLILELETGLIPAFWTLHPFNKTDGWGAKIRGKLADSDFSIIVD